MYEINKLLHGKRFVRDFHTRWFCIRNLTRSLRSLVRFQILSFVFAKYSVTSRIFNQQINEERCQSSEAKTFVEQQKVHQRKF